MNKQDFDEVIMLIIYGRSGSYFVHSLLDGHPDIIAIPPFIQHFFTIVDKEKPDFSTAESALDFIMRKFGSIFNCNSYIESEYISAKQKELANIKISKKFSFDNFRINFINLFSTLRHHSNSTDEIFKIMHYAYDMTLHNHNDFHASSRKKILYHIHMPKLNEILRVHSAFAKATILQTVRNPIIALHSQITKHPAQVTPEILSKFFKTYLFGGTDLALRNCQHRCIKLEQLHTEQEQYLSKLANFLNITWHDSLLSSTFSGVPWLNIKGSENISGFMPQTNTKDMSDIFSPQEIELLEGLFSRQLLNWGYTQSSRTSLELACSQIKDKPLNIERLISNTTNTNSINHGFVRDEHFQFLLNYLPHCKANFAKTL